MTEYTLHIDLSNVPSENEEAKQQLKNFNDPNKENDNKGAQTNALKQSASTIGIIMGAKQIASTASSVLNYRLGTVGARYGDTARQNNINNIMNGVNVAGGIVSSTIAGAVAAGPVGAAIMAATSIIGEAVEALQRTDEWTRNQQMNTMDEFRTSERLGLMKTDRNRGR